MTYAASLAAVTRTPVTLVILTMDWCARTFGTSPCLATGEQCYNTFPTCTYKTAFSKTTREYKFTSVNAPLPFKTGERPYLSGVDYLPTEIKTTLTVTGRFSMTFLDEPDTDVYIDPYRATRVSTVYLTSFWKKFLARNPNYRGRTVEIYEGFLGLAEADFVLKAKGTLESISISRGTIKMEAVDLLKSLSDISVPPKLDIKVVADFLAAGAQCTVTDTTGLDSPAGYLLIDKEIMSYSGLDSVTHVLSGLTRGLFGTTAADHAAKTKVQKARYFALAKGFDILLDLLTVDGGITASFIDSTAFTYWEDWPGEDIQFTAIIVEPTSLDKLYFEMIELMDCKSWVNEDNKITIRRNIPNAPDRVYGEIGDDYHIVDKSTDADLNEGSRLTRVSLYSDKSALGKLTDAQEYARIDVAIDADAESANEYNDVKEKSIYTRWLSSDTPIVEEDYAQYVKNLVSRILLRHRDSQRIINLSTEIKDLDLKTGDYIRISTDEFLNIDGSPLADHPCEVVKREMDGNKVKFKTMLLPPERVGFIADDATPAYDTASDAEKEYGFITDDDGLINGYKGYYIW